MFFSIMCSACIPLLVIRHENSKKYSAQEFFSSPFTKGANHYGFFRHRRRRRQINAKYYFFSPLFVKLQRAEFDQPNCQFSNWIWRSSWIQKIQCQKILVAGHETFTTLFWLLALCPKSQHMNGSKQAKNVYFSFILLICMMMCEKALPLLQKSKVWLDK